MAFPISYLAAKQTGDNLGAGRRDAEDSNIIESILANSMHSPQELQNNIGKILSQVSPERQGIAVQYLQNAYQNVQQKQQLDKQRQAAQQSGINPDLPPALQKIQYENSLNDQRAQQIMGGVPQGTSAAQPTMQQNMPKDTESSSDQGIRGLSRDQLSALLNVKGYEKAAQSEIDRRDTEDKLRQKRSDTSSKFNADINKDVFKGIAKTAEALPMKENALGLMKQAIQDKNLSFFSWDNIAEKTGLEGLRSPEGALFKTASKEFFLGNLSRAGTRPNQWIEQQISDMLPKIGRSTEANLSVERALQNEIDLDKERIRLTHEIAKRHQDENGIPPRDLSLRVNEEMTKFANEKQNELYNDLRAIKAISEKKPQRLYKVQGNPEVTKLVAQSLLLQFNNDPKKAAEEARKLGYNVP